VLASRCFDAALARLNINDQQSFDYLPSYRHDDGNLYGTAFN
jgi:hypothetical protein